MTRRDLRTKLQQTIELLKYAVIGSTAGGQEVIDVLALEAELDNLLGGAQVEDYTDEILSGLLGGECLTRRDVFDKVHVAHGGARLCDPRLCAHPDCRAVCDDGPWS